METTSPNDDAWYVADVKQGPWRKPSAPNTPVGLAGLVHIEGKGGVPLANDEFAGTRGESRRLEGFQIAIEPPVGDLGLRYMAHIQDVGDASWVDGGGYVGTRDRSLRLEGFAIELTGDAARYYVVRYSAHLQGTGDTRYHYNGEFCGTRGEERRVEGLEVSVRSALA
jgi:uncharacterized protein YjdB